jgi:hypothetical protein
MMDILLARAKFFARARWTSQTASYVSDNKIDLEAVNAFAGVIAVLNCRFFGNGHFDFDDEHGKPSAVIEAYGPDDESTIDFCAWSVDKPACFATMLGAADALGLARVTNPASWSFGSCLRIHRTPLAWLKGGCQGCCILHHRYVSTWLGGALGAIQTEDIEHE